MPFKRNGPNIEETRKDPSTSRSKTYLRIRTVGIHAEQAKTIRNHLLLNNVFIEEVKMAKRVNSPGKSNILRIVITGRILKN